jgi:two-component system nitrogen regulation sensor histidine kinase NtrY
MTFRRRLMLLFALTVLLSILAVALIISTLARRAFDRANDERTGALVAQFRREFDSRGAEVDRRTEAVARSAEANRMLIAESQPAADYSPFLETAQTIAEAQRLDFLEFADARGTIISSAQWPAKFGYTDALTETAPHTPFLKIEETPAGPELGLFATRTASAADHHLYVIGGIRLDKDFLAKLDAPAGMKVMLYENIGSQGFTEAHLVSAEGAPDSQPLAPIIEQTLANARERAAVIRASSDEEMVNAFPLTGPKNEVLGVLLIASSRKIYADLRNEVRGAALLAGSVGLVLAFLLSSWVASRVTKPVEQLAHAAREVAAGRWDSEVTVRTRDELAELASAFNQMTRQLRDQRDRLIQSERVAAWRELARRLAHELKNPLFPLQLTVENLLRAREQSRQQFDEAFEESATTLLAEISNLKNIVARFSDFSKMPAPQFQPVDLSELLESVRQLHQAQLDKNLISCKIEVPAPQTILADPELLHRALSNLVLNAIDAMPQGGEILLRAEEKNETVRISVTDSGAGLTTQEAANLFTPYFTTKVQGTGLGLAIVQSVVSDHGGKVSVASEPRRGTTFIIDLPANRRNPDSAQSTHV